MTTRDPQQADVLDKLAWVKRSVARTSCQIPSVARELEKEADALQAGASALRQHGALVAALRGLLEQARVWANSQCRPEIKEAEVILALSDASPQEKTK